MAGHSKWAQIKHQKGINDKRRGATFTKLARAITVAVKEGGGIIDPSMNFKLRLAVEKAREANMPKANIERAIDQGAGAGNADAMETKMYEGYGPAGVAVMVLSVSDNGQRSFQEVRQIFDKGGATLGQPGAVSFLFDSAGWLGVEVNGDVEEEMLMIMEISGVIDIISEAEGRLSVYTEAQEFKAVKDELEAKGMKILDAELIMKPKSLMPLSEDEQEKVLTFLERLEDSDEVQRVFTNAEL